MDNADEARLLGRWVRAGYSDGQRPSALLRRLARHKRGTIFLIIAFREAFGLSLAECKQATDFAHGEVERLDDAGLDGFLVPLIEERRARWSDRRSTTVRLPWTAPSSLPEPATMGDEIFALFRDPLLEQAAGSYRYLLLHYPPRTAVTATALIVRFAATRGGGVLAHWLTMLLASDEAQRQLGEICWRVGGALHPRERTVARLLCGPRQPLVEVGGELLVVMPEGAPRYIDIETKIPPLSDEDAARVARARHTGQCHCRRCELLREQHAAALAALGAQPSPVELLAEATRLVAADPIGQRQVRSAAAALVSFDDRSWRENPHGPAELQVLRDWLEERGAPISVAEAAGVACARSRTL